MRERETEIPQNEYPREGAVILQGRGSCVAGRREERNGNFKNC